MEKQEDFSSWIWLNSLRGISLIKKLILLNYFKEPYNILSADESELKSVKGLTTTNINKILEVSPREKAKRIAEEVMKREILLLKIHDKKYPPLLKKIYDPPILIYAKGDFEYEEKFISVVGSRKFSNYGRLVTEKLVIELIKNGYTIVSGMARGIDTIAQRTALNNGGRTIAVLGCGLDVIYPPENRELMKDIMNKGIVLTEFELNTKPLAYNFPMRNRIISGISSGVLVIEAGEKSGTLITADLALSEGREVFAVPGNITSQNSFGTNKLIKQGAKMVTDIDDILEELEYNFGVDKTNYINNTNLVNGKNDLGNLTSFERKIIDCLKFAEMHIDLITENTNLPIDEVSSLLVLLELKGYVKSLSGNFYCSTIL